MDIYYDKMKTWQILSTPPQTVLLSKYLSELNDLYMVGKA